MDTRESCLSEIERLLTSYASWINQGDGIRSNASENFYCDLLNTAWGYALRNMNWEKENFPAIDLGDDASGLSVQVTSTGTAEKVRHTLDRFHKNNLNTRFRRLIVLVAGNAECRPSNFKNPGVELEIWGTKELMDELRKLPDDTLEKVAAFLRKRVNAANPSAPAMHLPLDSSLGVDGFVGREDELCRMAEAIVSGVKPLVLWGLGGMGKTELAGEFGRRYNAGQVYFVTFRGDFRQTIADGIGFSLPDAREQNLNSDQRYELAMTELSRCGSSDILIIDNADRETGSYADLIDEDTYRALKNMPIRLILTTRFEVPRMIEVKPLPRQELYRIFENHKTPVDRVKMDALIDAVHSHTMTIDLMARTMVGGWKRVTAEMLLDALQKQNLNTLNRRPVGTDYNRSDRQEIIYDHLRTVFRVADIPAGAQDALRCAVLLPESGMDSELFGDALPVDAQNSLDDLLSHGWLQLKDNLVTIHPVVRLVCRTELQPTDENCGDFLRNIRKQYDPNVYDHKKYAQMASLLEEASTALEDQSGYWANQAGYLWNKLTEPQKALACNLRSAEKDEQHQPNSRNLAASYNNLGNTYGKLGDHKKALEYKLKALTICEQVLPENHPDLALSYNNVGYTYGELGDREKALEYQLKALTILEQVLPENHPGLAQSYNNVGCTYGELGDHEKELEYLLKALTIRERMLPENHPNLALSYNNVGSTYGDLGDHEKALEYKIKALTIRERVLPKNHPDLALSYNNLGYTYGELGDHEKKLEYYIKALTIREQVLQANHPDLAQSYNNVGSTYGNLGDREKELEYLLKALTIRERVLPENHPDLAQSYNNLGYTYGELGDHEKELEYYTKALTIRERVLPENHPDLATSYNNVAWTYYDMGDLPPAAKHMRLAAEIIRRSSLPENHPRRVNYIRWADDLEQECRLQNPNGIAE